MTQHLPAIPANIVDTNGAGDCLVAGALARLVQNQSPISALAFGTVSSMCMCSQSAEVCYVVKACQALLQRQLAGRLKLGNPNC